MTSPSPDFTIVERTLATALTDIGFSPKVTGERVETGFPMLALFRTHAEVATVPETTAHNAYASVEIRALGVHPVYGKIDFRDLVTVAGSDPASALERAASSYAETTLLALMAFFDNTVDPGSPPPQLPPAELDDGQTLGWHATASHAHVLDEPTGNLAAHLAASPPFDLITDILIEHLQRSGAVWTKLFATQNPDGKHTFGCTINGQKAVDAEMALAANWSQPAGLRPGWEFRQFVIVQPAGIQKAEAWRTENWRPDPEVAKKYDSFATSPANTKLDRFHYVRSADSVGCLFWITGILAAVATAAGFLGWWWCTGGVGALAGFMAFVMLFSLRVTREKFRHALLVPGVVTSAAPLQVAVLAPLANSRFAPTRGDVIKLITPSKLPGHPTGVGTRIPCVASFARAKPETPQGYWSGFDPDPLCWGTRDTGHLQRQQQAIGEEAFAELENHIASGHVPRDPKALFYIDRIGAPPPVPPPAGD